MKRIIFSLCLAASTTLAFAQTPVVVEPRTQRTQTTQATTSTYSSDSYSYSYRPDYKDRANHWAVGMNFDCGTSNPVWAFGLGANLQFYATDDFRIEASYNGYFRRNFWASWDVNINLHYLIEVADQLEIYPLLGATFCHGQFKVDAKDSNDGDAYSHKYGKLGLNIGAGIQYSINEHLFVKGEAFWKYVPSRELDTYESYAAGTDTKFGQRAVISAGIGYRF